MWNDFRNCKRPTFTSPFTCPSIHPSCSTTWGLRTHDKHATATHYSVPKIHQVRCFTECFTLKTDRVRPSSVHSRPLATTQTTTQHLSAAVSISPSSELMLTTLTSAAALKLECVAARGAARTALLETRTQRPSLAIHGEVVEALLLHAHWGEALEGLLAAPVSFLLRSRSSTVR